MGCVSTKILMRSGSLKEELQKLGLRRRIRRTDSYEEIIISKNGTEQLVAVLCSSRSNTAATKMIKEHESSTQVLLQKEEVEEKEPENSIETINVWELLAGLENDNEDKVKEKGEPSECISTIKEDSETSEDKVKEDSETSEVEKGFKRKMVANELAAMRVPAFEFARTGSLRDWLSQGGQEFSSTESYVTPRIGRYEYASGKKEDFFDPNLVSQFEQAMEDMTLEEEKILGQIM
ncbi:hypothetical protein KSP39_PZI012752 [Platanthera zijinensis]|uniref:Uncharacterized protein n=1 Tax=Platanthera zijinensis TaxID=2320716 RepID=A0AAP0G4I5_9ASPA